MAPRTVAQIQYIAHVSESVRAFGQTQWFEMFVKRCDAFVSSIYVLRVYCVGGWCWCCRRRRRHCCWMAMGEWVYLCLCVVDEIACKRKQWVIAEAAAATISIHAFLTLHRSLCLVLKSTRTRSERQKQRSLKTLCECVSHVLSRATKVSQIRKALATRQIPSTLAEHRREKKKKKKKRLAYSRFEDISISNIFNILNSISFALLFVKCE